MIEWGDAHASASWENLETVSRRHRPGIVKLVGFVAERDKTGVSIVQGFAENGDITGHFFIPQGMIIKIKKVRY